MTYKAPKVTTNILNISKLTENHLITKKNTIFIPFDKRRIHWHCWMTFDMTDPDTILEDRDIVGTYVEYLF